MSQDYSRTVLTFRDEHSGGCNLYTRVLKSPQMISPFGQEPISARVSVIMSVVPLLLEPHNRVGSLSPSERYTKDSHHEPPDNDTFNSTSPLHSTNNSCLYVRSDQCLSLNLPPRLGAAIGGGSMPRLRGRPTIGYLLCSSRALEMDDGCL
jgi:hypothetical protein